MSKTTSPVRVPDAAAADLYRVNVSEALPDAPPFDEATRQYAYYKPFPNEKWPDFKARIDMSFAGAAAANDPALPVWDPQKFQTVQTDEPTEQPAMDAALSRAFYDAKSREQVGWENPTAAKVLLKLAEMAGACGLLPHTVDPNTTEFAWSPVRCVFAAGGPALHARLCEKFGCEQGFPWASDDTPERWLAELETAHAAQGWPSTVAVVRWTALSRLPEPAAGALPSWLYWRAWVHVLTVMRYDIISSELRMVHDGVCTVVKLEGTTNLLAHQKRALPTLIAGLGCKSDVQKAAVMYVLARLTIGDLLPVAPYGELPLVVIAGRWSRLISDRSVDGWSECHMRVTNAWQADSGVVTPDVPDEEAVLEYSWPVHGSTRELVADLDSFKLGVPKQYVPAWPSDLLEAVFPNLTDCGMSDMNARRAILDVVMIGDMIRDYCPHLRGEFPLFLTLPDEPTLEASVNQGKTTFCTQYAKACVPGLSRAMTFRDSTSAPDQRAIADEIRRMGTICLDEFSIPRTNAAVLSRANMAALCTGGAVPMGLVLKNENSELTLRHPLFASAKALDLTEDLLTRGVFVFLRALTDAERTAKGVWEQLKTARLSILMRLGAMAQIEQHGLIDKLNAVTEHSTAGWRYGAHRSLAILLYQIRTGASWDVAAQAIVLAIVENKQRIIEHTRMADDNGVIMSQRESRDMRITLEQLFAEVTGSEAQTMQSYLKSRSSNQLGFAQGRASMKALMQARQAVDGRQDMPIATGFNQVTNLGAAVGERIVSNLLAAEIRKRVPEMTAWRLPGIAGVQGWFLYRHRGTARDGSVGVSMVCEPTMADHATLAGDLDANTVP